VGANTNTQEVNVSAGTSNEVTTTQKTGPVELTESVSASAKAKAGYMDESLGQKSSLSAAVSTSLNDCTLASGQGSLDTAASVGMQTGAEVQANAKAAALCEMVKAEGNVDASAYLNLRKGLQVELEIGGKTELAKVLETGVTFKTEAGITARGILVEIRGTPFIILNGASASLEVYAVTEVNLKNIGAEAGANARFADDDHVIKVKGGLFRGNLQGEALGTGGSIGKSGFFLKFVGLRGGIKAKEGGGLKFVFDISEAKSWTSKFVRFFKRSGEKSCSGCTERKYQDVEYDNTPSTRAHYR